MKNINLFLLLTLLIFISPVCAQSKDSLLFKTTGLKYLDLKTDNSNLDFKNISLFKNNLSFSTYNKMTNLNDIYTIDNKNYIYNKSSLLLKNRFRKNKIDSFNPYGTNNIGSALILGFLGSLLK